MAYEPIKMDDEDLEMQDMDMEDMDMEEPLPGDEDLSADLDPMFAADVAEAFPDLDDNQLLALQRAVLGLLGSGGGGMGGGF